ncbi:MAG TPA: hypothetical protein VL947_04845 [Cytophagales bacterium]|nr:hypothetical protein [Cytophagales bacterium]
MDNDITEHQIGTIIKIIDELVVIKFPKAVKKRSKNKLFLEILSAFCEHFNIGSPKELQTSQYDDALYWLEGQNKNSDGMKAKSLEKTEQCKAILVRGKKDLHMNKAKILNFAYHRLPLAERIYSLEKLSDYHLQKLEEMLFPERPHDEE